MTRSSRCLDSLRRRAVMPRPVVDVDDIAVAVVASVVDGDAAIKHLYSGSGIRVMN